MFFYTLLFAAEFLLYFIKLKYRFSVAMQPIAEPTTQLLNRKLQKMVYEYKCGIN